MTALPQTSCPDCCGTGKDEVVTYSDNWSERIGHCQTCNATGEVQALCIGCDELAITCVEGDPLCAQCADDEVLPLVLVTVPSLGACRLGHQL